MSSLVVNQATRLAVGAAITATSALKLAPTLIQTGHHTLCTLGCESVNRPFRRSGFECLSRVSNSGFRSLCRSVSGVSSMASSMMIHHNAAGQAAQPKKEEVTSAATGTSGSTTTSSSGVETSTTSNVPVESGSGRRERGFSRRGGGGSLISRRDRDIDSPFDLFGPTTTALTVPAIMRDFFKDPVFRPFFDVGVPRDDVIGLNVFDFDSELARPVRVDLQEEESKYILNVTAPRLKKEDLSVRVDDDLLIISGHSEVDEKSGDRVRHARTEFTRATRLPDNVETDKIEAKYEDGKLKIILHKNPKIIEEEKKKIINIQ